MMDFIKSIIQNTPVLALGIFGSLIGTIFTYVAPGFTRDTLCADEDFRLGNIGLCVFVHGNIGHFLGNMLLFIPAMLWLEPRFSTKFLLICFIGFAVFDGMMCLPRKTACCGISGVAYMFAAIAFTYAGMWVFRIILVLFFIGTCKDDAWSAKTDGFSHTSGHIVGAIIGTAYHFISTGTIS